MTTGEERAERAVAGDLAALEEMLREATPSLRAQLVLDPKWRRSFDLDDVLQVTFLEAFLRIRSLKQRTGAGFAVWLLRIAEHNLVDAVRALERSKRPDGNQRITRGSGGESARTLLLSIGGGHSTVGRKAEVEEEVARLQAAIAELPASYRHVVQQVDLAERSVREVADELQRSEGAVHMLRSRAHDRLQELLRPRIV